MHKCEAMHISSGTCYSIKDFDDQSSPISCMRSKGELAQINTFNLARSAKQFSNLLSWKQWTRCTTIYVHALTASYPDILVVGCIDGDIAGQDLADSYQIGTASHSAHLNAIILHNFH